MLGPRVLVLLVLVVGLAIASCPRNCSPPNGSCQQGSCICNTGWAGDDCSLPTMECSSGTHDEKELVDRAWQYYYIDTVDDDAELIFEIHQLVNGDCDAYVRSDKYPTRLLNSQSDTSRDQDFALSFSAQEYGASHLKSGTRYYLGIYGFENCAYTLDVTLRTYNDASCQCSDHGACNNAGLCECDLGYEGDSCENAWPTLDTVPFYDSVGTFEWKYYLYDCEDHDAFTVVVNQTSSACDADLYISYGAKPSIWDWDFRDASVRQNYALEIGEAEHGTYVVALFGFSGSGACEYDVYIELPPDDTCVSQCCSHGNCHSGTCSCAHGFSGDDCEQMDDPLPTSTSIQGFAASNMWNYYSYVADTANNIVISLVQQGASGQDCDVYVRANQPPTRVHYDYRDVRYANNVNITIENPQGTTWEIGVYGFISCSYTIQVYVEANACPNDCSSHGVCITGGRCDCDAGWAGEDCASRLWALSSGQVRNDQITQNTWVYYQTSVPDVISSLGAYAIETAGSQGFIWLYARRAAPPTLNEHDYIDDDVTRVFHYIHFISEGDPTQDNTWYIGIYGNDYIPIQTTVPYTIVAYSPPI